MPCLLLVEITIGLDVARVTVDEDVGMIELCASAVGELEREVVVSVAYQDRGAIGEGSIVPPSNSLLGTYFFQTDDRANGFLFPWKMEGFIKKII